MESFKEPAGKRAAVSMTGALLWWSAILLALLCAMGSESVWAFQLGCASLPLGSAAWVLYAVGLGVALGLCALIGYPLTMLIAGAGFVPAPVLCMQLGYALGHQLSEATQHAVARWMPPVAWVCVVWLPLSAVAVLGGMALAARRDVAWSAT